MSANPSAFDSPDPCQPNGTHLLAMSGFDGDDPTWAVAATEPRPIPAYVPPRPTPVSSASLIGRDRVPSMDFWPVAPDSFAATGLRKTQVESLILKFLLNIGLASGREIADQVALPFRLLQKLLFSMKESQLLGLKGDAPLGDYLYELSSFGSDLARRHAQQCTYFGAAPVPIEQYAASVQSQSLRQQRMSPETICRAFDDLVLDPAVLTAIGEALNLGRGLFLSGAAGNGKSSLAEHIARAFRQDIWIPRAISAGGEIVRVFDSIHHRPSTHHDVQDDAHPHDKRWVRIQRPTIIVGGELTLDAFDVTSNPITGINEAPLQFKSNCGTLVVDDFGRNRFRPAELLNRLVVPLERRADSLHLKSGRTFRVPFDCMVVFSSNEDPATILDEAFLRRIPYKIEVRDPDDVQFREVFRREAAQLEVQFTESDVDYLLQHHFRATRRPLRFCHPRDILRMVANACEYRQVPAVVSRELLDEIVDRSLNLVRPSRNGTNATAERSREIVE